MGRKNGKKKCGVELVLNGGKPEMDSATIPIQWFFSQEVIAKKPEYLLFFEQTERELKEHHAANFGRRYVCKVSDGVKFLQMFSPGRHRLMILALNGKEGRQQIGEFLNTDCANCYQRSLPWSWAEKYEIVGGEEREWGILAVNVVEFVVPDEFFAKKPETPFQKAVWKWVNLWHEQNPRDECAYGERKIVAFTLKPIAWLTRTIVVTVAKFCYRFIATIYIIAGNGFVFFFGFRPKPFGKDIADIWRGAGDAGGDWENRTRYSGNYKLWLSGRENEERGGQWVAIRMPIAPWEVCLIAVSGFVVLSLLPYWWEDIRAGIFFLVGAGVLVVYFLIYLFKAVDWLFGKLPHGSKEETDREREERKYKKQREARLKQAEAEGIRNAREMALREQRERRYRDWLVKNYSVDQKPVKVDLANLPAPLATSERVVQVFRVGFWALKAKICRPYSR